MLPLSPRYRPGCRQNRCSGSSSASIVNVFPFRQPHRTHMSTTGHASLKDFLVLSTASQRVKKMLGNAEEGTWDITAVPILFQNAEDWSFPSPSVPRGHSLDLFRCSFSEPKALTSCLLFLQGMLLCSTFSGMPMVLSVKEGSKQPYTASRLN